MKFFEYLLENSTGAFKFIKKVDIDIYDEAMHVDIDFIKPVKLFEAEYVLQNLVSNVDIKQAVFKGKTIAYVVKNIIKTDILMLIHELDKHNLEYSVNGLKQLQDTKEI